MYVRIDVRDGAVAIDVCEPYDFTSLRVRGPAGWSTDDVVALVTRQAGGRPAGPHAVWLPTHRVRRWASRRVGDTWESGFAAMLAAARQRSRSSDDGAEVMAQVEPAPALRGLQQNA